MHRQVNPAGARLRSAGLAVGLMLAAGVPAPAAAGPDVDIGPPAAWVSTCTVDPAAHAADTDSDGGRAFLHCDFQDNIPRQERYRHFAYKVLTSGGVQESSTISTTFDPTYQTLRYHLMRVHRDGRIIDKLSAERIETYQRESGMERHLYDGSLTAVTNLTDVRVGDVIEYAFTISGFNPIHAGGYDEDFHLQFNVPIAEMLVRVIASPDRPLQELLRNGAQEPQRRETSEGQEVLWRLQDLPALRDEVAVPDWYDPAPAVAFSTWKDWSAVVAWALPLYALDDTELEDLRREAEKVLTAEDRSERILQAVRFVQDDVRYLGFEGGLGGYRPHPPTEVLANRYGDCKDKALLLVALLRCTGVDAEPMLVHTWDGKNLPERLPSPGAFNHCITRFRHRGRIYDIDPTISGQGGDLDNSARPPYRFGLPIAQGVRGLAALAEPEPSRVHITTTITSAAFDSAAVMTIDSRYEGTEADEVRSYLAENTLDDVSRGYVDYYADAYPGIGLAGPLQVLSDERDGANVIETRESYTIDDFWIQDTDPAVGLRAEVHVIELWSLAGWDPLPDRQAPLAVGEPFEYRVDIAVELPETWEVPEEKVRIAGDIYSYASDLRVEGAHLEMEYRYERTSDHVPAAAVADFVADHARIGDDLGLVLTRGGPAPGFVLNWFAVALAAGAVLGGLAGARWLHRRYDPGEASGPERADRIGGWLILPAIGLIIGPVAAIIGLILPLDGNFDLNTWTNLLQADYDHATGMLGLVVAEIFVQGLFVAFSVLLLVQFFQRRSSFPRLYIICLAFEAVWSGLDLLLAHAIDSALLDPDQQLEGVKALAGALVSLAVWGPYFLVSKRVRRTFVVTRRRPQPQQPVLPEPATMAPDPGLPVPAADATAGETRRAASSLPGPLLAAVIFNIVTIMGIVIASNAGRSKWELPQEPAERGGFIFGVFVFLLATIAPSLVGIGAIFRRKPWSRLYNAWLFLFCAGLIAVAGIAGRSTTGVGEAVTGVLVAAAVPVLIAASLIRSQRSRLYLGGPGGNSLGVAVAGPAGPVSPPQSPGTFDAVLARGAANALFWELQSALPELESECTAACAGLGEAVHFPQQDRLARSVILSLEGGHELHLSVGGARFAWWPANDERVAGDCRTVVLGLLTGRYRLVEYLRDRDLVAAEIQRPQGPEWKTLLVWRRKRRSPRWGRHRLVVHLRRGG